MCSCNNGAYGGVGYGYYGSPQPYGSVWTANAWGGGCAWGVCGGYNSCGNYFGYNGSF